MQFEPLPSETEMLTHATDGQRLDYFLLRTYETDEIWGLKQAGQWFARTPAGATGPALLPLWPYRKMAREAALEVWQDCHVLGVSLEHFLEKELPGLQAQGVLFDVIPRGDAAGCLISPERLLSIFEGIIDAGEYRMDG